MGICTGVTAGVSGEMTLFAESLLDAARGDAVSAWVRNVSGFGIPCAVVSSCSKRCAPCATSPCAIGNSGLTNAPPPPPAFPANTAYTPPPAKAKATSINDTDSAPPARILLSPFFMILASSPAIMVSPAQRHPLYESVTPKCHTHHPLSDAIIKLSEFVGFVNRNIRCPCVTFGEALPNMENADM